MPIIVGAWNKNLFILSSAYYETNISSEKHELYTIVAMQFQGNTLAKMAQHNSYVI